MSHFNSYRDLYRHLLRQFYLGVYRKGDRLPTQAALASQFGVATNSIKKVFHLLHQDGFITSNRSFGTHLLFDLDNPEHMSRVPLCRAQPGINELDTREVPSRILAYSLYHGVMLADDDTRRSYLALLKSYIEKLEEDTLLAMPEFQLFQVVCQDVGNCYLLDFVNYLTHEYIHIDPVLLAQPEILQQVRQLSFTVYTALHQALSDGADNLIIGLVFRYYQGLYHIPNLMVFEVLDTQRKVFVQQALYTQLLHKLFLTIVAGNMHKGQLLPTESQLAQQYGVSLITVRKAASVLKELGLIDGQRFVGTHMKENWDSPAVQDWLGKLLKHQHKQTADALFAEYVIGRALCDMCASKVPPEVCAQMQQTMDFQWESYHRYRAPLFISEAILTPLVAWLDCPVLQRCYFHVHEELSKFLAMRLLQMSVGFNETSRVYAHATRALEGLAQGDSRVFVQQYDDAVLLNWELLKTALVDTVYARVQRKYFAGNKTTK